jgi:predicted nucleotidyltransferase
LRPKARTRDTETIKRLTELLIRAAKPNRIIMFGSQARGEAAADAADSDFDVMSSRRPFRIEPRRWYD